jgi:hypothetical protein
LFPFKPKLTNSVSAGNGFCQFQLTAKNFRNAPVSLHGPIAKLVYFFIGAALFLPGGNQRAVVKVYVKSVIVYLKKFHFKDRFAYGWKEFFPEQFTAARQLACGHWFARGRRLIIGSLQTRKRPNPVIDSALAYGGGDKVFRLNPFFTGFPAKEIHPERPVFKKIPYIPYNEPFFLSYVFYAHKRPL